MYHYFLQHTDCVKARDLRRWLHLIPTCHVTFLIDCEHNFIAKYGKQRTPDSVDMVEDPWAMLTDLDLTTVVYYLQPDMSALPQLTEEDVKKATGSLTETFSFALLHCFLQKKREKTVNYLSHRRFYEAMSFYWHKRGRLHKPFVPAVVVRSYCIFSCIDLWLVRYLTNNHRTCCGTNKAPE